MKHSSHIQMRTWAVICGLLTTASLKADFDGPYSLTPPSPGVYSDWQSPTNFGRWTAWGLLSMVNTSNAPNRLVLEVPAHSFVANGLDFLTHAAANGTVSFDCTTVSTHPGALVWVRQPVGANPTYVSLDTGPAGVPQHFDFPVQTGEIVGFALSSGSDVILPGDPWTHTLTVENFVGPVRPLLTMQSPTLLSWQGVSNMTYTVQANTNLFSTNWVTVGTVISTGTDYCFTNADTSEAQRFYRVICP